MSASTTRKRAARQLAADHPVGFQKALSVVDAVLASPGWMPEGELVAQAASLLPTSHHNAGVTTMSNPNTHLTTRKALVDHLQSDHAILPETIANFDMGELRHAHTFEHSGEAGEIFHDHLTDAERARQRTARTHQEDLQALLDQLHLDIDATLHDARHDGDIDPDESIVGADLQVAVQQDADRADYLEATIARLYGFLGGALPISPDAYDLNFSGASGQALTLLCDHGHIDRAGTWHIRFRSALADEQAPTLTKAAGPAAPHSLEDDGRYPMPVDLPCCGYSSASPAETVDHERHCRDTQ